jgi:hypothetical protein
MPSLKNSLLWGSQNVSMFSCLIITLWTVTVFPQLVAAQTLMPKQMNFATYDNPEFGITIQYPLLWYKIVKENYYSDNDDNGFTILFQIKPLKVAGNDEVGVSILSHRLDTPKNFLNQFQILNDLISQRALLKGFSITHFTSLLTKKLPEFVYVKGESGETTIGADNNTAQKIVYTYRDQREHLKVMEILVVNGRQGYVIKYAQETTKFSDSIPLVKKMLDSFRMYNSTHR